MSDAEVFLAALRGLERSAATLAFPDWRWTPEDTARITLFWDDDFAVEIDVYRAGDLAKHRRINGLEAVEFGMKLMDKAAE